MRPTLNVTQNQLRLGDLQLSYRVYRPARPGTGRRIMLVHGAGVAGQHTWEALAHFLTSWDEILVPDLRGAGATKFDDGKEAPFTVDQLVSDLTFLIEHLGWQTFDLGGYSLGGLVSMLLKQQLHDQIEKQYLLESAILDRADWQETVAIRQQYAAAAQDLFSSTPDQGIKRFLDTIAPNRKISPEVEQLTLNRLGERAEGFAHSLGAVNQAIQQLDREEILAAQGDVSSFIGGLSVDPMHQLHRGLADRLPNWHYFLVPGTDHSLPYQKPRQIARIMDQELARFLELSS